MADLRGFDASAVEPMVPFEPIPPGKYLAVITESEMKPTKDGSGRYLQLTFQIIDDCPYKGRYLWTRLHLENSNITAVQIARAALASICRAVGVMKPNESYELHNIPLVIHVKQRRHKETGEVINEIQSYEKRSLPTPPPSQTASAPPWKRA